MHRATGLPEIDGLEARRRPTSGAQVTLSLLQEMKQVVAVAIGCRKGGRERLSERGGGAVEVEPLMRRRGRRP